MTRSALTFFVIAIFATYGFAQPVSSPSIQTNFTITYTDRTIASAPHQVVVRGSFRNYDAVQNAIHQIHQKGADWCGFGLEVVNMPTIMRFWSSEDSSDFNERLRTSDCVNNELKHFYKGNRSRGKETLDDHSGDAAFHGMSISAILAILFGGLSSCLFIVLIVLCIVNCSRSAQNLPSHPPPYYVPQYPAPRHRSRRSGRRSHKSSRSERYENESRSSR